jgi:PAS domain-containing protein
MSRSLPRPVRALAALMLLVPAAGTVAQATEPAHVLVLGVYHFANPGLDVVRTEVADVLTPEKQAEIAAIVEALARFEPTKVAVEHVPAAAARLDSLYRAYRAGHHELDRGETQQLGFRLAERFGHDRLYPFDHRHEFPFGAVVEYAQRNDPASLAFIQAEIARMTEEGTRRQREWSIDRILRAMNEPDELALGHGQYLQLARVGAGTSGVGADLLASWYERNIRMFSHLQAIAGPGERVLVIVGAGHAPILRDLTSSDPGMVLVEAIDFLP